jgi:hypothetical protein
VAAVIGIHEDVGAALQFGIDAARRFELEGAGAGPGDDRVTPSVAMKLAPHHLLVNLVNSCEAPEARQ